MKKEGRGRSYYLSPAGRDEGMGTCKRPWKTIARLNQAKLGPGDTVFFQAGATFEGTILIDSTESGRRDRPVLLCSAGKRYATIRSGSERGIALLGARYITLRSLRFLGAGRKLGNTKEGVLLAGADHVVLERLEISGYQKAGLMIYSSRHVSAERIDAHDNGFAGISVSGRGSKEDCQDIRIVHCRADNNPGDPTEFNNHSGNGIIAGFCKKVVIEYCSATENGWDMPRTGNGPVGIWVYEADSAIIRYCISYHNKTSKGGGDGGGFDLDGGVTHSLIEHCLSYANQGSGFGIFQYAGASPWHDNIIRDCISENDGSVSAAGAGVFIWNSSRDEGQFRNCHFDHNIVYNAKGAAITYSEEGEHAGFVFTDNIFVTRDALFKGREHPRNKSSMDVFRGNCWWSLSGTESIKKALPAGDLWARPFFKAPGQTNLTDPDSLPSFDRYALPEGASVQGKGVRGFR